MSANPLLYGNLTPLDRVAHKNLRLNTELPTLERVKGMNSLFLAAVEFVEACKEFPIVFVRVGDQPAEGEKPVVAPLAVLGLKPASNLFIKDGKWTGNYIPAYLRRYPFAMARVEQDSDTVAVCFDGEWAGFSETEGSSLFAADGQPTEFLLNAKTFLENFEQETERTRVFCQQLVELDLLRDMRFQATMANGEKLDVEGFLAVDEEKLSALDDAKVGELHRSGLLALLGMHRVSMGNMNLLATRESSAAAA